MFDLISVLLPAKKDPILKKRDGKKYTLITLSFNCLKMILALLIEIVAFHMQIFIV